MVNKKRQVVRPAPLIKSFESIGGTSVTLQISSNIGTVFLP